MAGGSLHKPYHLLRSFSLLSLLTIVLIGCVSVFMMSQFLNQQLLERDAVVSEELFQSLSQGHNLVAYFRDGDAFNGKALIERLFEHVAQMPDVMQVIAYNQQRMVVWSNQNQLIGKPMKNNVELEQSFTGKLVFHRLHSDPKRKVEHGYLPQQDTDFLENYIPIWTEDKQQVIGVVELYKKPVALWLALDRVHWLVIVISLIAGVVLYIILFSIVRHASRTIQAQQKALLEAEKLAVLGEMTSAIAHSLRNPLAAIRSSAELNIEHTDDFVGQSMQDITQEVDRLNQLVRELLVYSNEAGDHPSHSSLYEVINSSLEHFGDRLQRQNIQIRMEIPSHFPAVQAHFDLLCQVVISLISNAMEAMPEGGELILRGETCDGRVIVHLIDTGQGLSEEQLRKIFRPLITRKANGLGMGLLVARRILQRYGGSLELKSQFGQGTTALLQLPVTG